MIGTEPGSETFPEHSVMYRSSKKSRPIFLIEEKPGQPGLLSDYNDIILLQSKIIYLLKNPF